MTLALLTRSGATYAVRFVYRCHGRWVLGSTLRDSWPELRVLVLAVLTSPRAADP